MYLDNVNGGYLGKRWGMGGNWEGLSLLKRKSWAMRTGKSGHGQGSLGWHLINQLRKCPAVKAESSEVNAS